MNTLFGKWGGRSLLRRYGRRLHWTAGQIIQFWHDAPPRTIVAPSLEAWLGSLVRTLEAEDWKAYEYYKETGEAFFIDWEPDIPDYLIRKMGG